MQEMHIQVIHNLGRTAHHLVWPLEKPKNHRITNGWHEHMAASKIILKKLRLSSQAQRQSRITNSIFQAFRLSRSSRNISKKHRGKQHFDGQTHQSNFSVKLLST